MPKIVKHYSQCDMEKASKEKPNIKHVQSFQNFKNWIMQQIINTSKIIICSLTQDKAYGLELLLLLIFFAIGGVKLVLISIFRKAVLHFLLKQNLLGQIVLINLICIGTIHLCSLEWTSIYLESIVWIIAICLKVLKVEFIIFFNQD